MRLVLIEWLDSFGCSTRWQDLDGPSPAPLICKSVGFLLHDNDDCKVIVPHLAESKDPSTVKRQGCGDMTIPTQAVLKIIELTIPG